MSRRLSLPITFALLLVAIAFAGFTLVNAQPRNLSYVCIDQLNCLMVDEESSPAADPQFVARIDVKDSRTPRWVHLGSACPDPSRTDIVADNAVRGSKASQWHAINEGGNTAFVFQASSPVEVTVYYGRLDVEGGTMTADSPSRAITAGTWRCISRMNPNAPVKNVITTGATTGTNNPPTVVNNPQPNGNRITAVDTSHCKDDVWAKAQIGTDIQGLGGPEVGEDCSWVIRTAPLGAVTIQCPANWVCTVTVEGKNLVFMGGNDVTIGPKVITAGMFRYAPGFADLDHKIRQLPPCTQLRDEDNWGMSRNPAYHVYAGNFTCG